MTTTSSGSETKEALHELLDTYLPADEKEKLQEAHAHDADDAEYGWLEVYIQLNQELTAIENENTDSTAYKNAVTQASPYKKFPEVKSGELTAVEYYADEVCANEIAELELNYLDELKEIYAGVKEQNPSLPPFEELD